MHKHQTPEEDMEENQMCFEFRGNPRKQRFSGTHCYNTKIENSKISSITGKGMINIQKANFIKITKMQTISLITTLF